MDTLNLEQVLSLFDNSTLSELELSCPTYTIKLKRSSAEQSQARPSAPVAKVAAAPEKAAKAEDKTEIITSPIVGTFYLTPAPDAPPYVRVGSTVQAKDVLCTIEAMKLMNQLEADYACEIVEILAKPESMVEFGQPLFKVKRI
ncbi:MAG: acetyl-CoA carboxylase biotin carboxyl carrier protein [Sphaerochaeta sp.]